MFLILHVPSDSVGLIRIEMFSKEEVRELNRIFIKIIHLLSFFEIMVIVYVSFDMSKIREYHYDQNGTLRMLSSIILCSAYFSMEVSNELEYSYVGNDTLGIQSWVILSTTYFSMKVSSELEYTFYQNDTLGM